MRRLYLAVSIAILLAGGAQAGVLLQPYEVARHKDRMRAAERWQARLDQAVTTGATSNAKRAAKKLTRLLSQEEAYWRRAGLPDALSLAQQNREAAESAVAGAAVGDYIKVRAAGETLRGSCVACHQTHPERRILVEH
jgi:hypothetical protein